MPPNYLRKKLAGPGDVMRTQQKEQTSLHRMQHQEMKKKLDQTL